MNFYSGNSELLNNLWKILNACYSCFAWFLLYRVRGSCLQDPLSESGMVEHTFNLRTWKTKPGGSLSSRSIYRNGYQDSQGFAKKACPENNKRKKKIYLQSYCIHETFQICQMKKLLSHLLNFISHYTQYSIIQSKFIKGENSAILIFIVSSPKWKHRTKWIVTILNTYMFILCWVIFTGYVIMSVRHLTDP